MISLHQFCLVRCSNIIWVVTKLTLPGIHQQIFPSLVAPILQSRLFLVLQVKSFAQEPVLQKMLQLTPKTKTRKFFAMDQLSSNYLQALVGLQHDHKKLSSIAPIMIAGLTTRAGQSLFMTWMDAPNLAGIFAAPPCGTCSLARNIKIRGPKGNIISGPIPLRSPKFPEGFPNLANTNLKRVLAANNLYDFLAKVVLQANDRNLIFVIENLRSSLYWLTKYFQKIKHLFTLVAHQTCAYGSERPKWTALAVNRPAFLQVNMTCPGVDANHHHKPWGLVSPDKFATAEETACPPKLVRRSQMPSPKLWPPMGGTHQQVLGMSYKQTQILQP